jgi:hypothetical protein
VLVLPDGCRDIIYRAEPGCRPKWFVSRLFDTVKVITLQPATLSIGLRIAPGARFEEKRLLQELGRFDGDDGRVIELIEEFTHRAKSVEDALEALAENGASVSSVARRLGTPCSLNHRPVARLLDPTRACSKGGTPFVAELFAFGDRGHLWVRRPSSHDTRIQKMVWRPPSVVPAKRRLHGDDRIMWL